MLRWILVLAACVPPPTPVVTPPQSAPFAALCGDLPARRAARARERERARVHCDDDCENTPILEGEPGCTVRELAVADAAPPWQQMALHCNVVNDFGGPASCRLVAARGREVISIAAWHTASPALRVPIESARVVDALPGEPRELAFELRYEDRTRLVVCRDVPAGCDANILLAEDDWRVRAIFDGSVMLVPDGGTPPDGILGLHALEFTPPDPD